tara:strand:+ start:865 stop:1119 length:255 start_codon:yes stop_codon:yes gene_type:complete
MTKRETLVEGLKNNLVKVRFTKVNGDERVMNCTLHESILPEPTTAKSDKKTNQDTVSVWDIDKGGWRSFRVDSIKEYKVLKDMI